MTDAAVATSGTYERGSHTWHGLSGRRHHLPGSTTVVGPRMVYADACATVTHAMSSDGLRWIQGRLGYSVVRVDEGGRLSSTLGIALPG